MGDLSRKNMNNLMTDPIATIQHYSFLCSVETKSIQRIQLLTPTLVLIDHQGLYNIYIIFF